MGVDEKVLELIEKQVTKELNRLHDWLETESQKITALDKESALSLEKLKGELKQHVDDKITALEEKLDAKLVELDAKLIELSGGGLGVREKVAVGGGVGLGALALIKHILDMFGITGGG